MLKFQNSSASGKGLMVNNNPGCLKDAVLLLCYFRVREYLSVSTRDDCDNSVTHTIPTYIKYAADYIKQNYVK